MSFRPSKVALTFAVGSFEPFMGAGAIPLCLTCLLTKILMAMTKEENLIEKKSTEFSQDVFEHLESGDMYRLEKFEKKIEPYWRLFQNPELQLKFLRAFWPKFDALVKAHETGCKAPECGVSSFHLELEVYLNQLIERLSILSGEGFDPLREEKEKFDFLRAAYLVAKGDSPGSPYSVMISTDGFANLIDFPKTKVIKLLTELGDNGFVTNTIGAGHFFVTTSGYEYLVEFERHKQQLAAQTSLEHTLDDERDEIFFPAPLPADTCIKIFIIYSRTDQPYKVELEKHLKPLVKSKRIEIFSDTEIEPGKDWDQEIRSKLAESHLVLIFVSPDLLASDYAEEVEVKEAFKRKNDGDSTLEIIPLLMRRCDWKGHPEISKLNHLPKSGQPVSQWVDQDEALTEILGGVKRVVARLTGQKTP